MKKNSAKQNLRTDKTDWGRNGKGNNSGIDQRAEPEAVTAERREERRDKHHNTRPGIPAEKKKHKLKTTIMSYVHE